MEKARGLDTRTPVLYADAGTSNLSNSKYNKILEIMQSICGKK
jgi:ABC-type ATPase involved in cell division